MYAYEVKSPFVYTVYVFASISVAVQVADEKDIHLCQYVFPRVSHVDKVPAGTP
jgi:hypothetical protein